MAVPGTDDTNSSSSSSSNSSAPQAARPSWEAAPRPAAPRQAPAPQPAPARPAAPSFAAPAAEAPSASPYYASPKAAPSAYSPAPSAYAPAVSEIPTYAPAVSEAPAYDPDARYDLAGNLIPSSGSSAASPTLAAPFGYSAGNNATPGVWPPAAGGQAQYGGQQPQYGGPQYGAQAYRNNSGEQSHLPPELERLHWHWGAFFFPILWTKKHGLTTVAAMLTGGLVFLRVLRYIAAAISPSVFLIICMVYGLAYFGLQVFCGFNGHKIGWRNRHFPGGVEEYFKVQNAWMWWGFGVNVLLGPIIAFGIFAAIVAATLGTTHHAYRPYGSSSYSRPSTYGSGSSNYGSSSNGTSSNGDGSSSSAGQ